MKPYQQIPIAENHEPLVAIPRDRVAFVTPHPYEKLGAPYGDRSPFCLRQSVCDRLLAAQTCLQKQHPDWRILVFDAFRPVAVQDFMVEFSLKELAQERGLNPEEISPQQRQELLAWVHQFWAAPSLDPATPPPHSTGGAIDVTLVDDRGQEIDMGSPIDELSERSYPLHFANSTDPQKKAYHQRRELLFSIMRSSGFQRHPQEWWHFCFGEQMWAWLTREETGDRSIVARYGGILSVTP